MALSQELVYLNNSYVKELSSRVLLASGNRVYPEKVIFYPGGGGQPADTGEAIFKGASLQASGGKDENGVYLELSGQPAEGEVLQRINWSRRYMIMRLHSALHLIDAVIRARYGSQGMITGGQIFEDHIRADLDFPGLNRDVLKGIEEATNQEVRAARRINVKYLPREEALKVEGIARTRPGMELLKRLDVVRVIEIEGLDQQMDGGTHVANTSEIGQVMITKLENKGAHNKRIEVVLGGPLT